MADVTINTLEPPPSNRFEYYDYLHFIPAEQKTKYWAAQVILFVKNNSNRLIALDVAKKFRDKDLGILDKKSIIDIIDPKLSDKSGGDAKYFAGDFKANPINLHLKKIQKARLDQLPLTHTVNATDEYFQTNQQMENSRILGRKYFLSLINELNKEVGLPILKEDDDPFKYAAQVMAAMENGSVNTADGKMPTMRSPQDLPTTMLDNIKASIEDNETLALFNEYMYKDGVESALELAIEYYIKENKFHIIRELIFSDLFNFNTTCFRYYTSKTSGRPIIEYEDPANIFTSNFAARDGSDLVYWWTEKDVTFSTFVRMFGAGLSQDDLKKIFEKNRETLGISTGNNLSWEKCSRLQRDNAKIRIGYIEWETQDMEVYGGGSLKGNIRYSKMSDRWEVSDKNPLQDPYKDARYYNCWYKCYYLPAFGSTNQPTMATSDFDLQAKYIFDFGKLQDQVREGDDLQFSKPSLILWHDPTPSYGEIEDRFMGKIDLLWQQFQNDLANAMPHGLWFNDEIITEGLELLDEAQDNGKDNKMEVLRRLKQTGYGFGKMFDDQGKPIPPFIEIKANHLASAQEKLNMMFSLYAVLQQSQGGNDIAAGQTPEARTPLGGIEFAMEAASDSTYYLKKAYVDVYTELGKRLVYYIREIVAGDKNGSRFKEFTDIVSKANSMALEAIDGIPLRTLGLTVDMANTEQANAFINQMALEMATAPNGLLEPDEALELTFIRNVKYKFALLRMKIKKKRKQRLEEETLAHKRQMELIQANMQADAQKLRMESQLRMAEIDREKQWDAQMLQFKERFKLEGSLETKDKIKDNRIEQDAAKMQMETNKEQQTSLAQ